MYPVMPRAFFKYPAQHIVQRQPLAPRLADAAPVFSGRRSKAAAAVTLEPDSSDSPDWQVNNLKLLVQYRHAATETEKRRLVRAMNEQNAHLLGGLVKKQFPPFTFDDCKVELDECGEAACRKAMDGYRIGKGAFSTYLGMWLRGTVSHFIRTPEAKLLLSPRTVALYRKAASDDPQEASMSQPVGRSDRKASTLESLLADEQAVSPAQATEDEPPAIPGKTLVAAIRGTPDQRHGTILALFYGLLGTRTAIGNKQYGFSVQEIGPLFEVSPQRANIIKDDAFAVLARALELGTRPRSSWMTSEKADTLHYLTEKRLELLSPTERVVLLLYSLGHSPGWIADAVQKLRAPDAEQHATPIQVQRALYKALWKVEETPEYKPSLQCFKILMDVTAGLDDDAIAATQRTSVANVSAIKAIGERWLANPAMFMLTRDEAGQVGKERFPPGDRMRRLGAVLQTEAGFRKFLELNASGRYVIGCLLRMPGYAPLTTLQLARELKLHDYDILNFLKTFARYLENKVPALLQPSPTISPMQYKAMKPFLAQLPPGKPFDEHPNYDSLTDPQKKLLHDFIVRECKLHELEKEMGLDSAGIRIRLAGILKHLQSDGSPFLKTRKWLMSTEGRAALRRLEAHYAASAVPEERDAHLILSRYFGVNGYPQTRQKEVFQAYPNFHGKDDAMSRFITKQLALMRGKASVPHKERYNETLRLVKNGPLICQVVGLEGLQPDEKEVLRILYGLDPAQPRGSIADVAARQGIGTEFVSKKRRVILEKMLDPDKDPLYKRRRFFVTHPEAVHAYVHDTSFETRGVPEVLQLAERRKRQCLSYALTTDEKGAYPTHRQICKLFAANGPFKPSETTVGDMLVHAYQEIGEQIEREPRLRSAWDFPMPCTSRA